MVWLCVDGKEGEREGEREGSGDDDAFHAWMCPPCCEAKSWPLGHTAWLAAAVACMCWCSEGLPADVVGHACGARAATDKEELVEVCFRRCMHDGEQAKGETPRLATAPAQRCPVQALCKCACVVLVVVKLVWDGFTS